MVDTKRHLCDSCCNNFPTCISEKIEFGDGLGNDNVIECSGYNDKNVKTLEAKSFSSIFDIIKAECVGCVY